MVQPLDKGLIQAYVKHTPNAELAFDAIVEKLNEVIEQFNEKENE